MRYYTVHAPFDEEDEPEQFRFVKDGLSWPALFFPVLWILWHRLWLTLVYYVVFALAVAWTGRIFGDGAAVAVAVLGTLLLALEGNNIRRLSLSSRGWSEVGASFGRNLTEAEARFFAAGSSPPLIADRGAVISRAAYTPEHRAQAADEPILGLFPEPER